MRLTCRQFDAPVGAAAPTTLSVGESETGVGVVLGLGYDIRVGRNLSFTPFWNGFAVRTSNADVDVGQIGFGLTVH